jgi:hypothetical protein
MNNTYENMDVNPDDFAMAGEDFAGVTKLQKILCDEEMRAFVANVLIRNTPTKKLSEYVGTEFWLKGYYVENFTFKDESEGKRDGKYTVIFGKIDNAKYAFSTTSVKILDAVQKIKLAYGEPSTWDRIGIKVRIRSNDNDGILSYTLEVLN